MVDVEGASPVALPPVQRAAAKEWLRRVQAEYTSAARTHGFVGWLIQAGAPPELIRAGLRIVDDELEHAALSHAVVRAAGVEARPAFSPERLELPRTREALLADLTLHTLDIFCLGETVAVPLFVEMRKHCEIPEARAALDRIVVDEVRHRDFGWEMLDWLLYVDETRTRAWARELLPGLFAGVKESYGEAGAGIEGERRAPAQFDWAQARRWGLMPVPDYARILARCFERDYVPRFEKRDIDARALW